MIFAGTKRKEGCNNFPFSHTHRIIRVHLSGRFQFKDTGTLTFCQVINYDYNTLPPCKLHCCIFYFFRLFLMNVSQSWYLRICFPTLPFGTVCIFRFSMLRITRSGQESCFMKQLFRRRMLAGWTKFSWGFFYQIGFEDMYCTFARHDNCYCSWAPIPFGIWSVIIHRHSAVSHILRLVWILVNYFQNYMTAFLEGCQPVMRISQQSTLLMHFVSSEMA